MTITPTRRRGLSAAFIRIAVAGVDALRRIPAWQGVTLTMACAAGVMVVLAPGALLA